MFAGLSLIPAKRSKCQASAWLLEVTGFPRNASAGSMVDTARKFVQETNTPSQSSRAPIFLIDSRIDSEVIRPTQNHLLHNKML